MQLNNISFIVSCLIPEIKFLFNNKDCLHLSYIFENIIVNQKYVKTNSFCNIRLIRKQQILFFSILILLTYFYMFFFHILFHFHFYPDFETNDLGKQTNKNKERRSVIPALKGIVLMI